MNGVALLAEGVDRNFDGGGRIALEELVALLAEGVDRNDALETLGQDDRVALLAEGVDRNILSNLMTRACLSGRPPRGGRG